MRHVLSRFALHDDKEVSLSTKATEHIDSIIVDAYRNRDKSFGNARFVHDLIDKAKVNMGLRIMDTENPSSYSKAKLGEIIIKDVDKIKIKKKNFIPNIPIDEILLKESLSELDILIGIEKVKKEINYFKKDLAKPFHTVWEYIPMKRLYPRVALHCTSSDSDATSYVYSYT